MSGQRTEERAVAAEGWTLERHADGRLVFGDAQGILHADVDVLRAFPISAPEGPVVIVASEGGELAWVESLAEAPAALRTLVERELAQREFLPVIERIEAVSDSEPAEWTVVTDRGPHRFSVGHTDDIAHLPDGGVFITDTCGVRYRIPDVSALDTASRRTFERTL